MLSSEAFGKIIKEKRVLKGLTQKELAEKLNVTDKAVSKWETGRSYPDMSLLEPLSQLLNIQTGLLEEQNEKKTGYTLERSSCIILLGAFAVLVMILLLYFVSPFRFHIKRFVFFSFICFYSLVVVFSIIYIEKIKKK